jgi:type IV secretion system protein TrbL
VLTGLFAFAVWIELAVRSGAVAVATLFLPLALAGSAFPATALWPRRLGETLAALVLSKLVIVAVLALAVGMVTDPRGGVSALVEGLVLFALSAIAPFALARLLPMVEAGAVAHLDGLGRRTVHSVSSTASSSFAWITGAGSGGGGGGRSPGQEGAPGGTPPGPRGGSGPSGGGLPERSPSSPHPMPPPPAAAPAAADPRGTVAPGANPPGTSTTTARTSLPPQRLAPVEAGR